MNRRSRAWWITASNKKGWHWDNFLDKPKSQRHVQWGGPNWISSTLSFRRIGEMRKNDYVIAYQAGEGILGIAQLQSGGYIGRGSQDFDSFDLRPGAVLRFSEVVPLNAVQSLPNARDTFEFLRVLKGTVFGVGPGGFEQVLFLGAAFNPGLATRLVKLAL